MNEYTQPRTDEERARRHAWLAQMSNAGPTGKDATPHDDGPNPGEFSIDWSALKRDWS
jgi:hypothetical protein